MKKQLSKKLSAFIVTAMMFSVSANAQIVYTDVIPDTSMTCPAYNCTKSYNLDLNNDGIVDFTLHTNHTHFTCQFQGFKDTKSVSIVCQSGNLAAANMLNAIVSIGSNLSFSTNSVTLRSIVFGGGSGFCPVTVGTTGSWADSSDHYLGLRFSVGANTYYGWVRLNVVVASTVSTVSCTVKDYAYNSIPNQAILAGQTATGITENSFASSIHLFPNPATNHLTITLGSSSKKAEITILDITGKIIYSTTASETQKIEVNTKDFAEGIYVFQIKSADFIETRKLIVEK